MSDKITTEQMRDNVFKGQWSRLDTLSLLDDIDKLSSDLARLRELLGEVVALNESYSVAAGRKFLPVAHQNLITRIQSELKGICSECGGTGEVQWDYDDPELEATVKAKAPCPKCQSELKE